MGPGRPSQGKGDMIISKVNTYTSFGPYFVNMFVYGTPDHDHITGFAGQ
jgi:hypothetical protein